MSNKFEITTRHFVLAHGHEPRGRGGWAFEATMMKPDGSTEEIDTTFMPSNTYASARAAFIKRMRDAGYIAGNISVCT